MGIGMIKETVERKLYSLTKLERYPKTVILIEREVEGVIGTITINDEFEENLWKEAIKMINQVLQALNKT
jgi:hypothetical protein